VNESLQEVLRVGAYLDGVDVGQRVAGAMANQRGRFGERECRRHWAELLTGLQTTCRYHAHTIRHVYSALHTYTRKPNTHRGEVLLLSGEGKGNRVISSHKQASFPDIIIDPRKIIPHLQWILK